MWLRERMPQNGFSGRQAASPGDDRSATAAEENRVKTDGNVCKNQKHTASRVES
jgi:hypothetical protein